MMGSIQYYLQFKMWKRASCGFPSTSGKETFFLRCIHCIWKKPLGKDDIFPTDFCSWLHLAALLEAALTSAGQSRMPPAKLIDGNHLPPELRTAFSICQLARVYFIRPEHRPDLLLHAASTLSIDDTLNLWPLLPKSVFWLLTSSPNGKYHQS